MSDEGVTGNVQDLGNKAVDTAQQFANGVYDIGEEAIRDALATAAAIAEAGLSAVTSLTKRLAG
jgi:hypothetical protein